MGHNFRPVDRDQQYLMPPSLRDWLPEGDLAWLVLEVVGELDLGPVYARYRADGWGAPAFDPAMMTALLLYAYATGERSSRRIEARCHRDIAYRVIAANQAPDHATIARFRADHEAALGDLFGQVLRVCAAAGLAAVGLVAVDGTKLAADAAEDANRAAPALDAEIAAILAEAAATDAAEDERYGPDRRGDELPAELADPRSRLARLREARRQLAEADAQRERAHEAQLERRAAGRPAARARRPPPAGLGGAQHDRPRQPQDEGRPGLGPGLQRPGRRRRDRAHPGGGAEPVGERRAAARAAPRGDPGEPRRGRGRRAGPDRPGRRRLLERGQPGGGRATRRPAPPGPAAERTPAGPDLEAAQPAGSRADAPPSRSTRHGRPLQTPGRDRRAGLRPDEGGPRRPPLQAPRLRGLRQRVAADLRDPQPAQAVAPRPPASAQAPRRPAIPAPDPYPGPASPAMTGLRRTCRC